MLVGSLLLLALWPLFVLVGVLVALETPGGAIFRQWRVGRRGVRFVVYKFRSMTAGADRNGPHFTSAGDPRVTRVGRWIRKLSLDELPQLLNVVKGEMSLVGPRPDTPRQETDYLPEDWQERCSVRPGITGLSQATLRSSATPEQRLYRDLEYVRSASLGLDLKILALTVRQVLGRGGN